MVGIDLLVDGYIPSHNVFSLSPDIFLEEMISVTGIALLEAIDLTHVIERRQEEQYAFCMLRSARNSERWYGELKEYLAGYGIEVTKRFQPQNLEIAQIATEPLRQEPFYCSNLSLRELKAQANPNLQRERVY